jgi:carboxylesterase type B
MRRLPKPRKPSTHADAAPLGVSEPPGRRRERGAELLDGSGHCRTRTGTPFAAVRRRGLFVVVTALALCMVLVGGAAGSDTKYRLVIPTDNGKVRGAVFDGVQNFLGIPYAKAPTGALRWRPPAPAGRWRGVRDASRFGNVCPQRESLDSPRAENEDCLVVNVQRPLGTRSNAKLPVYVYIHGGGFVGGSGNNENLNAIVRQTGVLGVTMNYRLGVFGFLAGEEFTQESGESGNYGFQDQQAALRWVRRNIAAFGGDPGRVTIGGESAGGWSVCGHLVSPGSRGLFAHAMVQSGACPTLTQEEAEAAGANVAASLGCTGDAVAACMRGQSAGALLDVPGLVARLVRGTSALPVDPREQVAHGRFAHVPVVIGATRDEGRAFTQDAIGWSEQQYVDAVRERWGDDAEAVLARYPWPSDANRFTAAYLLGAILTDSGTLAGGVNEGIGGCGNRSLTRDISRYVPTWAYEWFPRREAVAWFHVPGYEWGAAHATELPYLFPDRNAGANASEFETPDLQLARELKDSWGAFVRTGNPNTPALPEWPRYDQSRSWMSFRSGGNSVVISDAEYVAEHRCDFWDTLAAR